MARSLAGIGADLESLAACLEEVAETSADSTVSHEELALCVMARAWAGELQVIVTGIRTALDEDDSGAE